MRQLEAAKGRYLTRIDLGLKKIENVPPAFVNRQRLLLRHVRVCLAFTLLELGGQSNESEAKKLLDEILIADPSYHQAAAGLFLLYPARRDLLDRGLEHCKERMNKAPGDLSYPFHRAEMELLKGELSDEMIQMLFIRAAKKAGRALGFMAESVSFLTLTGDRQSERFGESARTAIALLRTSSGDSKT